MWGRTHVDSASILSLWTLYPVRMSVACKNAFTLLLSLSSALVGAAFLRPVVRKPWSERQVQGKAEHDW